MHTKSHQILRKGTIALVSFISGILITVVAAATYDATIQDRATKMLTAIRSNASGLTSEDTVAYYSLIRDNIQSLIAVLTEVDKGLIALSGDIKIIPLPGTTGSTLPEPNPGNTGSTNPGTGSKVCTGTYPKDDPKASFWPNGGFTTGGNSDQNNTVWKYKYKGTCMFDCATGYSYSATSNSCVKDEYTWMCGATTGGETPNPANCTSSSVGTRTNSNCICTLTGGPKGNPIAFTVPEGVFDMAAPQTLTTRLPNVGAQNLLLCQEILAHPNPNVQVNQGICNSVYSYSAFPGNPGWKYNNGGYDVTVPYDAAIFGAAGIKTRFFLKDKTTNQVATYTISVKNSGTPGTSPGTTPGTNPGTTPPNPPKEIVCTGPVPMTNVIKTSMPASMGVGDWNNTVWQYNYGGSCSWRCEKGYVPSPAKTSCVPPAPGTGVAVTVVDKNGAPVSGVALGFVYNPAAGEDGWVTNPSGYVEMFPEVGYPSGVLTLNKAGYIIYSAEGCTSRNGVATTIGGQPYSYCDGTSTAPGTKIKIVMMPTPSNFQNFMFIPQKGTFYIGDTSSYTMTTKISGVSKADTLSCVEVTAHPNVPNAVNTGYCSDPAHFEPFNGNADWTWSTDNGGTWNGNIKYDATYYGAPGIRMRVFLKNKATNQVATFDMEVYKL